MIWAVWWPFLFPMLAANAYDYGYGLHNLASYFVLRVFLYIEYEIVVVLSTIAQVWKYSD